MIATLCLLIFLALLLTAAISDAVRFRIPNWIPAAMIALFPVFMLATLPGFPVAGLHLLAGILALLLGMALFAPGWIGGGDAKLFAAAALWFGWSGLSTFLLATIIAGGLLSVVLLIGRRMVLFSPTMAVRMDGTALATGGAVPYGIAIAGGAFWALSRSPMMAILV